jgi:SEC-C motif-containing protein
LLAGRNHAQTATQLMRSRYSAFVQRNAAYLRKSWHPDTCPAEIGFDDNTRWLGLKIIATLAGKAVDSSGEVEFVARYKLNGRAYRLHENSRFVRYRGEWVYLDGKIYGDNNR